jgi:hypothetical protein
LKLLAPAFRRRCTALVQGRHAKEVTVNHSLKGALLSGLVFPGLGQVILKHYKRGTILILTFSASLVVILIKAVQQAFTILERIELEGGAIDMSTISKAATQASTTSDSFIFKFFLLLSILCWIVGVVDAYRVGRKKTWNAV